MRKQPLAVIAVFICTQAEKKAMSGWTGHTYFPAIQAWQKAWKFSLISEREYITNCNICKEQSVSQMNTDDFIP